MSDNDNNNNTRPAIQPPREPIVQPPIEREQISYNELKEPTIDLKKIEYLRSLKRVKLVRRR